MAGTAKSGRGIKIRKIITIDGKTMRGNQRNDEKPAHIASTWCDDDGFCPGQTAVMEKSNEITAIPELLNKINIKGQVSAIDAMGTQTAIAEKIRDKKADYVPALKGNQKNLYDAVREYFSDSDFCRKLEQTGQFLRSRPEKAHGQIEIREYYQTDDIHWLPPLKEWRGLKSIGMERKTIQREGKTVTEYRFFISSLKPDIRLFSRAVRQHWPVEVMYWHLDVTFRKDANHTIDKITAQNLNIIRKWCLSILQLVEIFKPKLSIKK